VKFSASRHDLPEYLAQKNVYRVNLFQIFAEPEREFVLFEGIRLIFADKGYTSRLTVRLPETSTKARN
jgi:hypothetical protein